MVRRRDLDFADVLQAVASQHQLFKSESPAQESPVTGDTHDCGCSPYLQPSENVPIAVDQELFHWAQEAMVPDYFVVAEGAPSWEDTVYWNPLAAPFWDDQLEGAVNPVAQLCSADLHEFTIVLSQVPPGWCDASVEALLCSEGFRDQFNFVHVTHEFAADCGVVAVINFKNGVAANAFHSRLHGRVLESQMVFVDAAGIQGLRANRAHYHGGNRLSYPQLGRGRVYDFGSVKHRNGGKGGKRKGGVRYSHDSRKWQADTGDPHRSLVHHFSNSNSVPPAWVSGRDFHSGAHVAGPQ
uniref:Uncharacterized protein n=1 Tax=Oxyrrhis marina TaxID=2969 RepID=A0A7S3XFU9_OXYMA